MLKPAEVLIADIEAIAHVAGLGLYECTINGEKPGNKVLNPVKTNDVEHQSGRR